MIIENSAITILASEEGATIELYDRDASSIIARVALTSSQFCQALSRLSHTDCEKTEVFALERIGKKMEQRPFEFMISEETEYSNRKQSAVECALLLCPDGWTPGIHFGSQDSFFTKKNDKGKEEKWARTFMKRWVDKEEGKG